MIMLFLREIDTCSPPPALLDGNLNEDGPPIRRLTYKHFCSKIFRLTNHHSHSKEHVVTTEKQATHHMQMHTCADVLFSRARIYLKKTQNSEERQHELTHDRFSASSLLRARVDPWMRWSFLRRRDSLSHTSSRMQPTRNVDVNSKGAVPKKNTGRQIDNRVSRNTKCTMF